MKNPNRNHQMTPCAFIYVFFLLLSTISGANRPPYIPTDRILLSCGGAQETTDEDGRKWTTDIGSKFAPGADNSLTSTANGQDPSVPQVPFMTARIFHSKFTYSFPVASSRKFVRLYFYPSIYNNLNASNALFGVNSGSLTLLKNFSVLQTTEALNFAYIVKEFVINVVDGRLNVTFHPSSDSYAFVNGIEVVSMPDIYSSSETSLVGQTQSFTIDNSTSLEKAYRLNVGGNDIPPTGDSGLFRYWSDDFPYLFGAVLGVTDAINSTTTILYPDNIPEYVAPSDVYGTARTMGPTNQVNLNFNLTWIFPVDPGFYYLVRLHFCEIELKMSKINQRVFEIFINNQTAYPSADVAGWTQGYGIPVFKDYIVSVPQGIGQQDLWIALHPNASDHPQYYNAILNGLEIFKVNDSTGNLAGPNPIPAPKQEAGNPSSARQISNSGVIAGGVAGGIAAVFLLCFIVYLLSRFRRQGKDSGSGDGPSSGWLPLSPYCIPHFAKSPKTNTIGTYASSVPSNLCHHFSFSEIKAATNDFDEALLLGVGGFGRVYKGEMDGGNTKVAIKRGDPLSQQGIHEFQTEIEMLSKHRHLHLVSLIGYCEENCEMILVYDYMAHGTLREHLYRTQKPPLPWKQRLEICIGAACGLHYLHTGGKHTIIHRDVKTTNILLDEKWVAKVSDFGLSRKGPTLDHTHVSTMVKGSFGYLDPEYFRRQQLTEKSDVYSFGVVLFEVLCARPPLNPTLEKEQVSLAEWAVHCQKNGILDQIIDPFLKGKIAPECFKRFAETAEKCVADQGLERPAMGDILSNLELALQLQESAEENGKLDSEEASFCSKSEGKKDPDTSPSSYGNVTDSKSSGITVSTGNHRLGSENSDGLTPNAVFSQLMNPKGR